MILLENDFLRLAIRRQGAEMTSLTDKQTQTERLWQAAVDVWPWHAPNLFPVVGGCVDNQLLINRKTYPMPRHGFARQSEFELLESTLTHALFLLRENPNTRQHFPYAFRFEIGYELQTQTVNITYRVVNPGDEDLYFSVGAHPAFAIPLQAGEAYEDYYLAFEKPESLLTHRLSANGLFSGETESIRTDGQKLWLTRDLFDRDALVFKNLNSREVTLRSRHHAQAIRVRFADFPYLGLWAKPGADFVCIEPWLGCADSEGPLKPIEQKEAIQRVAPGDVFSAQFSIEVLG